MTPIPPLPAPRRLRAGCAVGALLAALAAGPAWAQITAETVREEFETEFERMGTTVEVGAEEAAGGGVTLSDVVLSFEFTDQPSDQPTEPPSDPDAEEGTEPDATEGPEEVRVEALFETIAFEEQPDGAVRVTLSPEGRMTVRSVETGTGEEDVLEFRLVAEGFEMTVAEAEGTGEEGAEAGRRYAYAADRLGLVLEEAVTDGAPVEASAEAFGTDLAGSTVTEPGAGPSGEATRYVGADTLGELTASLNLPAQDPEAEGGTAAGRTVLDWRASDLALTTEATVPGGDALAEAQGGEDPMAAFEQGLAFDLALTQGPGSQRFATEGAAEPSENVVVESESEGGAIEFAMDADALSAASRSQGVSYVVEGAGLPVPRLQAALTESELALEFPLSEGEEARPFALRLLLSGLTLNEEVWALFDPESRLARDAAEILVALEGRVRLLADLTDAEAQAAAEEAGETPVEIEDATLTLRLDALGATVDAGGEFSFDNADTTTFGGVPAPTGTLTIESTGIDALLDTLTDMGLVPPDQLVPARLMLGLFARPDGEGGYTSEIAVDGETGEVTANGQRLR